MIITASYAYQDHADACAGQCGSCRSRGRKGRYRLSKVTWNVTRHSRKYSVIAGPPPLRGWMAAATRSVRASSRAWRARVRALRRYQPSKLIVVQMNRP